MNDGKFIDQVIELSEKIREIQVKLNPQIFTSELTFTQFLAVYTVQKKGKLTLKDFANELNIAQSSASALVDRLVKLKVIKRIIPESDRRKTEISATAKGELLVRNHIDESKKIFKKIFEKLSSSEQHDYYETLKKFYTVSLELYSEITME